jgi:membrane protein required for beta-lactamase induction
MRTTVTHGCSVVVSVMRYRPLQISSLQLALVDVSGVKDRCCPEWAAATRRYATLLLEDRAVCFGA